MSTRAHLDAAFFEMDSVSISLGKFSLKDISLSCEKGAYHILLGPTGSGKSTLMKCILGLLKPQSGRISLGGKDITRELPERRRMGYVPQNYALFPHLNVEENLRFGVSANRIPVTEADAQVSRLCGMLNIEKLRKRKIHHLSGGEKQKVAIGRALCTDPEMILLDEPFSSIDEGAKRGLWFELKQIAREVGITTVHITHNLDEAYTLGERLTVLIDGRAVQSGPKEEIFERPAGESVARYLSYRNIFGGEAKPVPGGTRVDLGHFSVVIDRELPAGGPVKLCVRSQDIKIIREGSPIRDSLKRNVYDGRITNLHTLSDYCLVWFAMNGSEGEMDFEIKIPRHVKERHTLFAGKQLRVALWEPSIIVL